MIKKDKIIIDIEYSKSDIHFTDEQIEEMVNKYCNKIITSLQDVNSDLYFNAMALASISAKDITRQENLKGWFCSSCGKMKKNAYSSQKVDRCKCKRGCDGFSLTVARNVEFCITCNGDKYIVSCDGTRKSKCPKCC